jgi:hypothetical protein
MYVYIMQCYTAIERNAIPVIVDAVNGSGEHQMLKVVRCKQMKTQERDGYEGRFTNWNKDIYRKV